MLGPPWGKVVVRPWVKRGKAVTIEDLARESAEIRVDVRLEVLPPTPHTPLSVDVDPMGGSVGGTALEEESGPPEVAGAGASRPASAGDRY